MLNQKMYVDDKFMIRYMNPRTAREHCLIVSREELFGHLENLRSRNIVVNYLPFMTVGDETHL